MHRYELHPIADENVNSLLICEDTEEVAGSDDYAEAKRMADAQVGAGAYGVGILDTATGEIDVGFGLGVPCPAIDH